MIDVSKFENRIVKFKRISEDVEKPAQAEIRRIDYDHSSALPRYVTARFVGPPLNAVMTLNYDKDKGVFRGGLGPDIIESDFDIDSYIKSHMGSGDDTVVRSRRRGRAKF